MPYSFEEFLITWKHKTLFLTFESGSLPHCWKQRADSLSESVVMYTQTLLWHLAGILFYYLSGFCLNTSIVSSPWQWLFWVFSYNPSFHGCEESWRITSHRWHLPDSCNFLHLVCFGKLLYSSPRSWECLSRHAQQKPWHKVKDKNERGTSNAAWEEWISFPTKVGRLSCVDKRFVQVYNIRFPGPVLSCNRVPQWQ